MIKADSFAKQYKKIEIFLIFIFFIIIYFFLFFYKNHFLIGRWESGVIYDSLMPATELLLPSIQIAGDTAGEHGIGYPMLKISKYFSSLFGQNTITIKLLANIYGVLSLILFFKIIFEAFGVKVAYCSTGLFLSSYYFQIMHGLLISPPLTLLLIFFCIDRFNNFDNKKFGSYFLVALSSAFLCMNYIVGRYVLLIIFFCFLLDKNFIINSNFRLIDLKKIKDLFKIILFMILILVIVYPPNIQILFSKNILIPFVAVGEHSSFELKEIYRSLIGNLIYIYHLLVVGTYTQINIFDLTFGKPFVISPKIFIFFFLIGFFSSYKEKNSFLFYFLFISILFLNLMSKNDPSKSIEVSSSISSFRLYSLIPFYFLFSSLGVLYLINKITSYLEIKKNYTYFFITLLIIFNALSFAKERSAFYSYVENISIDFDTSAASKDRSIKFQDELNQIYFFKLSKYIQEKMYSINRNDSKDEFNFIYLDEDYFTPSYYPPGWGGYPSREGELHTKKNTYYFPMFTSFYLSHQNTVGYLIRKKDQYFWWKKISTLVTNQEKFDAFINAKLQEEIISRDEIMGIKLLRIANNVFGGGIFKFINNDLINDEDKDADKYIIYNPSYFKKLSHVIISDKEQLNFVKENFVMDITYIE